MKKITTLLIALILFPTISVFSQTVEIRGVVTSQDDGTAIPGVTVSVKGTTMGTTTDIDGNYSMKVPPATKTLVFSYIGMKTKEIDIAGRKKIDVAMKPDIQDIDEVVVTALGIKSEKKALGYSTSEVGSDELVATRTDNFATALSGKVAGLNITSTSSQGGSGTRIVLRGGSSITGSNEPLFVVNGVPFEADNNSSSSGLADIDPNAIESLSVLKGAAASALYGSRAANGVILITLKAGSMESKPKINFRHTSSFDKIYEIPLQKSWSQGTYDFDAKDWQYIDGDTQYTSSSWGPRISDLEGVDYYDRWQVFDTGYTADNTISINGGSDKATYYVSYTNTNNDGVVGNLGFKRNTVNANTSFSFTPKLKVSSNAMYSSQDIDRFEEGYNNYTFMNTFLASPNSWNPYPIYDDEGALRLYRGGGRDPYLYVLDNLGNNIKRERFSGSVSLEYKILKNLTFASVTGVNTSHCTSEDYKNKGGLVTTEGFYNRSTSFTKDIESTEMLTFDDRFGDFSVNIMGGHNIVQNYWESTEFEGDGLVVANIYNSNNVSSYTSATEWGKFRSWSLFGKASIGYKSMLYYTVTGRNDWASSIKNGYFYPSHSLSFLFSELIPDRKIMNLGKIRLSYAKVGAPADAYSTNVVLEQAGSLDDDTIEWLGYAWPFNGQNSYLPSSTFPNEELENEFKSELEAGLEMKLFKNRLGIDLAVYKNWSDNQILWQQLLNSTGYEGGYINIGGITHKGIELVLTGTPVKTRDFSWDISLNWSKDKSRVDDLGENDEPIDLGSSGYAIVGQPFPVIYDDAFLRDDDGNLVLSDEGDASEDRTTYGRPIIDTRGSQILGKIEPDWRGGIRNSFRYKNFMLATQIDFQKGGLVVNYDEHYLTYYGMSSLLEDRPEDNRTVFEGVMGHYDSGQGKVVISDENNSAWTYYSSYWQTVCQSTTEDNIQPRDYIKLREVSLTYSMPASITQKLRLGGIDVTFSGRNLWRKFKDGFTGADVDTNTDGIDNGNAWFCYSFPALKTYSFTLGITL